VIALERRTAVMFAAGSGLLFLAVLLAVTPMGPFDESFESFAIILAPLAVFLLVEGYLAHRRRRLRAD